MLEGRNAGCRGVVGVLTGARSVADWGKYWHTHIIPSIADLPGLLDREFA
jgi:phosphoglycolate phosphatase-like HAD superfamily hydrolase